MDAEWDGEIFDEEFNNTTREFVIFFLILIALQFFSYALISFYKKPKASDYPIDYDDVIVYSVSLWTCNFSLSVSIGAALLLPISIMSNEILLLYPNSYYIRWLNISLIQGLWNMDFFFSNLAIFILLPFAFFFSESQGFSKSQKGIKGRMYETLCVLTLVGLLILSMICVICAICGYKKDSFVPFFNSLTDYFPFLYSCLSFLGVLLLLICTPIGFTHIFTVVGNLVSHKPILDDEHAEFEPEVNLALFQRIKAYFKLLLQRIHQRVVYPFAMLCLMFFTFMSMLMVAQNMLLLCFGIKTLPMYSSNFSLGISSLSVLGPLGAFFEIVLILYLWCSSIIGLYSLPLFGFIRPKLQSTPMTNIMANCVVLLILSSALPVLARTIGITNFDLLGSFGQIHWLGNIYIVLFYNIVFAASTAMCLGTKITATLCQEVISLFRSFGRGSSTAAIKLD